MRALLFILLCAVFSPLLLVGSLVFAFRVRFVNMLRGISGTAYEPYMARLALHLIGSRRDDVSERIAPHLPALSPLVMRLLMRPMAAAARWSGFRGSFFAYPGPRPSTLITFISHRTHFFDSAIAAAAAAGSPIRQFVFLGAGWDTRAYGSSSAGAGEGAPADPSALAASGGAGADPPNLAARASEAGLRIFEVDEPPTQQVKVEALRAAGAERSHATFAPTDFNQQSWLESLVEHGFDPEVPAFILWEGVTMYLDDAAVAKTLAEVAGLAPGSRIAFDFLSRELVLGRKPYALMGTYMRYALKSFYGESMHFGISTAAPARQQVLDFFEGRGLDVENFEPLGREAGRSTPIGGLVVASR